MINEVFKLIEKLKNLKTPEDREDLAKKIALLKDEIQKAQASVTQNLDMFTKLRESLSADAGPNKKRD